MGIDRETDIQVVWYRSRGREANRKKRDRERGGRERERERRTVGQIDRKTEVDKRRQTERESNRLNQKQRERPRYVALVPPPFPFLPNLSPPPPPTPTFQPSLSDGYEEFAGIVSSTFASVKRNLLIITFRFTPAVWLRPRRPERGEGAALGALASPTTALISISLFVYIICSDVPGPS